MTSSHPIQKPELLKELVRAAVVRSIMTLLSVLPFLGIAGAVFGDRQGEGIGPMLVVVGGPMGVAWLVTRFYCRGAVSCPHCGASLWDCGTGNFKPRRMKVRDEVRACPNCRVPIA
jgi:hypothetical protein